MSNNPHRIFIPELAEGATFTVRAQLDDGDGGLITSKSAESVEAYDLDDPEDPEVALGGSGGPASTVSTAAAWSLDDVGYTWTATIDTSSDWSGLVNADGSHRYLIEYKLTTGSGIICIRIYIGCEEIFS